MSSVAVPTGALLPRYPQARGRFPRTGPPGKSLACCSLPLPQISGGRYPAGREGSLQHTQAAFSSSAAWPKPCWDTGFHTDGCEREQAALLASLLPAAAPGWRSLRSSCSAAAPSPAPTTAPDQSTSTRSTGRAGSCPPPGSGAPAMGMCSTAAPGSRSSLVPWCSPPWAGQRVLGDTRPCPPGPPSLLHWGLCSQAQPGREQFLIWKKQQKSTPGSCVSQGHVWKQGSP